MLQDLVEEMKASLLSFQTEQKQLVDENKSCQNKIEKLQINLFDTKEEQEKV